MIYDLPEQSSPISQGDIFIGVPILDLPDDELPVIDDTDIPRTLPWEEFASAGEKVTAVITVRPTIAIVGTQECDALRAPNITLFEVRPFRDVERKSKDTSKPSKWVPILTQHARINQKWFYLPADERIGFSEKMAADFLTPLRIPRIALERLTGFRKGRLNEVARQHFRERLAEFFRRYAYDEWYPLTPEELAEYQKNYPDAEPFSWQHQNRVSDDRKRDEKAAVMDLSEYDSKKTLLNFLAEGAEARDELAAILSTIDTEIGNIGDEFKQHVSYIERFELLSESGEAKKSEYVRIALLVVSDMSTFSERVEDVLPKFEKNTQVLDRSFSAYVSSANPESTHDVEQILILRNSLSQILSVVGSVKKGMTEFRDTFLPIRDRLSKALNMETNRQWQGLDGLITNIEELRSFTLRVIFLIDEKFGKPPISEDKAE